MTLLLAACGGGGDAGTTASPSVSATTTLSATVDTLPESAATQTAVPTFHLAPVQLQAPDDVDASGSGVSAQLAPRVQLVPAELAGLSSRRLTPDAMNQAKLLGVPANVTSDDSTAKAGTAVVTYSPAQIRAAYGLPATPVAGASLTAAQAAQLGAGQTIYIVNAKHDPNIVAELAAFNTKFGLPGCSSRTLAAGASLPLAAASKTNCELVVAYSTAAGGLTATAPAYDSGWATEIALDVQWAHAIAPLARLVLIEAPDAGVASLSNAVALANKMGPGVVSMSFGAAEGSWTASYDSVFTGAGMSYLAATGDNGAAVSWPSVSSRVLAVGGTTLSYSGTGSRSETTWTGTGGGTSAYVALPAYQSGTVGGYARRAVADVAFNANPNSGQYVATLAPGSTTVRWVSAGGTSLSTPQWAGLLAVTNALRVAAGKTVLGQPHAAIYQQIGAVPTQYSTAFKDVTSGSNGSCGTCAAKAGYDTPTGWGTPNGSAMITALSGATVSSTTGTATTPTPPAGSAPKLTTTSLTGTVRSAFSATIGYSAPGATSLSITISGVPSGMAFTASASARACLPRNDLSERSLSGNSVR